MNDLPIKAYLISDKKTNDLAIINCEAQIDDYITTKIFKLSSLCFDLIKGKYQSTAFVVEDGSFLLFSIKNAILIKNNTSNDKIKIIGGPNTRINKVTSLAVSKSQKSIVVVDNHKNVLVFDQNTNGDIGPIKQFKIDKTISSELIEIDEDKQLIRIFDSSNSLIEEFSFKVE
jgi:hypothetical protein